RLRRGINRGKRGSGRLSNHPSAVRRALDGCLGARLVVETLLTRVRLLLEVRICISFVLAAIDTLSLVDIVIDTVRVLVADLGAVVETVCLATAGHRMSTQEGHESQPKARFHFHVNHLHQYVLMRHPADA